MNYDKEKYREVLDGAAETILILTGQSTETGRKIGSGGMSLYRNVEKT
ncbi:MAG: hypothetical protein M3044_12600 [Thermoproteota archaeon]|nr:hypothetical protein [Thermoproteota archaeon]